MPINGKHTHRLTNSLQAWQEKQGKLGAEFNKVISCDTHGSMAALPLQAPIDPGKSAMVRFMDCTISEGHNFKETLAAHHKFGSYMDSKGSKTSAWLFFPGMGAGKISHDYKLVLANADYPSLAFDSEIINNGGGWEEAGNTFGKITNCDSPRLYHAELIRSGAKNWLRML